jgi:hypothetical protein
VPPFVIPREKGAAMPSELPADGFTIADLRRRWRCGSDKIYGFIHRGELVAINLATNLAGRAQYRVTAESVKQFEARRSTAPLPKPKRKKRTTYVDFFPDL